MRGVGAVREATLFDALVEVAHESGIGVDPSEPLLPPVRAVLVHRRIGLADWLPPRARRWYLARAIGAALSAAYYVDLGAETPPLDAFAAFLCGPPGPLHAVPPDHGALVEIGSRTEPSLSSRHSPA